MRILSANSPLSILYRENSAEAEKLQIPLTQGVLRKKQKSPDQRADSDREFIMGWLISFPPLALIAESSNLFSTNTINCGIGDFVTSSLKIWFS